MLGSWTEFWKEFHFLLLKFKRWNFWKSWKRERETFLSWLLCKRSLSSKSKHGKHEISMFLSLLLARFKSLSLCGLVKERLLISLFSFKIRFPKVVSLFGSSILSAHYSQSMAQPKLCTLWYWPVSVLTDYCWYRCVSRQELEQRTPRQEFSVHYYEFFSFKLYGSWPIDSNAKYLSIRDFERLRRTKAKTSFKIMKLGERWGRWWIQKGFRLEMVEIWEKTRW